MQEGEEEKEQCTYRQKAREGEAEMQCILTMTGIRFQKLVHVADETSLFFVRSFALSLSLSFSHRLASRHLLLLI